MENYSMYMPSYSIGAQAYDKIPAVCERYGKKIIAIGGHRAVEATKDSILSAISKSDLEILDFIWYGGEASYENVEILMANLLVQEADMIFAIGGGKALDTCKCLAVKADKPVFTFPTIASNCAATTSVSIMYHPTGVFREPFFFAKPAEHAFIQTTVIAKAPTQYMWAGMGDTYAKYYESTVSGRDEELIHYHKLGMTVSLMCKEPILQYGAKAMQDNRERRISYELEQVVLAIVVTTGMASIFLTAEHIIDYNTGLAHAIFYTLTSFPHIEEKHLHGEVVGYGVLVLLLCDGQREEFERLYAFHKSVNLPTKLADLELTRADFDKISVQIAAMPDVRHWPYEITVDMLTKAVEELENRE